jgi:hypothetical protein
VPLFQPATPGLIDTVAHVTQVAGAMGIGSDDDFDSEFPCPANIRVVQIQPLGLCI